MSLTCRTRMQSKCVSSVPRSPTRASIGWTCNTRQGATAAELDLRTITLEAGGMVPVAWRPMAVERVRYAGEPWQWCGPRTGTSAEDLAEAVVVDYSPLPAGTPIHEAAPDDVLLSRVLDSGGVDEALAHADLVIERTYRPARQSAVPLETRGVVAEHDTITGVTTVWTSTQLPHLVRRGIAHCTGRRRGVRPRHSASRRRRLRAQGESVCRGDRRWPPSLGGWAECACGGSRTVPRTSREHARPRDPGIAAGGRRQSGRLLAMDAQVRADVGAYSVWPRPRCRRPQWQR